MTTGTTTAARATIHRHRLMFGRSRSRSTSPLTPNATARERLASVASDARRRFARVSSGRTPRGCIRGAGRRWTGGGWRTLLARINEARRLIESIRAKMRNESDASRRERRGGGGGDVGGVRRTTRASAARSPSSSTRRPNPSRIQWIGFIQWIDARGRADGDADGVGVGVGARTDGVAYVAERQLPRSTADASSRSPDSSWLGRELRGCRYGRRAEEENIETRMTTPIAPTMVESEAPPPPPPIFEEAKSVDEASEGVRVCRADARE